jgi:hypothetical protein
MRFLAYFGVVMIFLSWTFLVAFCAWKALIKSSWKWGLISAILIALFEAAWLTALQS